MPRPFCKRFIGWQPHVALFRPAGVSADKLKNISYGKERPVAVCNDISCWSQNRRAVTVLAGGQS